MNAILSSCLIASLLSMPNPGLSQEHAFSVKDDIAMVRFSEPSADTNSPVSENARTSPDGKHIAVVTTQGLLDSDRIESTISVFDLDAINRFLNDAARPAPKPRVVATVRSYPHREQLEAFAPLIKDLLWSSDSTHLYFRAEMPEGGYQLDAANADGSPFRRLTPSSEDVDRFDVVGHAIVYSYSRIGSIHVSRGKVINQDALDVTGYRLMNILFPQQMLSYQPTTLRVSVLGMKGEKSAVRDVPHFSLIDIPLALRVFPFRLSPRADQLITVTPVEAVPAEWENFQPAASFEHRRLHAGDPALTNPENSLRPREYSLVNLSTGNSVPLIYGPNAEHLGYYDSINTSVWSPDESRVLVTNVFLPLGDSAGKPAQRRTLPCAVASVDLPSRYARCLFYESAKPLFENPRVVDVAFGRDTNEVFVFEKMGSTAQQSERYEFEGGDWRLASTEKGALSVNTAQLKTHSRPAAPDEINVTVRQGLNAPPTLWASNSITGKARQLWDPNPQFAHIAFGDASVYTWKDKDGRSWVGGLVKPVGYRPGRRYPCVIQMYQFRENQFLTDGTDPSAFAARELASAGFVVLQIRKKESVLSEADPAVHLEAYRSAIDSLSKAGLIDRSRVGVVGFSWTCWYVINALIKDPFLFKAATIADGLDNSYMQYILFSPGPPNTHEQMDKIRGASPFGAGLKLWVRDAPGFHLDQVQAPVRIEAINPTSVLQEWELYSSLYLQNKPVDLIYFPRGTHIHQKPLERLESQQGDIDWMRFWLQGYEDPDPAKHSQYERWREMKNKLRSEVSGAPVE